jgi:hypothetical protein
MTFGPFVGGPPAASTQHRLATRQQIRGQQTPQQAPRAAHSKLSRSPRSEVAFKLGQIQFPSAVNGHPSRPKPSGPAGGRRAAAASATCGAVLVAANAVGEQRVAGSSNGAARPATQGPHGGPRAAAKPASRGAVAAERRPGAGSGSHGYQPWREIFGTRAGRARLRGKVASATGCRSATVIVSGHVPQIAASTHAAVPNSTACPGHRQRSASSAFSRYGHASPQPMVSQRH